MRPCLSILYKIIVLSQHQHFLSPLLDDFVLGLYMLCFYFSPYFYVSPLLCKKLHEGWGWGLSFVHCSIPTPRTGDAVRHSKYLLNGFNEGFASVFSPVLRISEPAMEIKVSIPSTPHYHRFSAFVFTFAGNYFFDFHLFTIQIFHPLHHSVLGWPMCSQRRSLSFLSSLLISMTLTYSLQDL